VRTELIRAILIQESRCRGRNRREICGFHRDIEVLIALAGTARPKPACLKQKEKIVNTLILIVVLVLLFGGGGGYYWTRGRR
jgi:hypothetical protein